MVGLVADEQCDEHPAEHRQGDLDEGVLQLVEAPFKLVETCIHLLETLADRLETGVNLVFELVETAVNLAEARVDFGEPGVDLREAVLHPEGEIVEPLVGPGLSHRLHDGTDDRRSRC